MKTVRVILFLLFLCCLSTVASAQKTLQNAATATGNGATLTISYAGQPVNGVVAQVSGTFSGTITFRATLDGTNWIDVEGTSLANSGAKATTATAPGLYSFACPRIIGFRAVITTYGSGSITVVASAATGVAKAGSGGSGTVTDLSIVTANGVSGSVADSTTTPAITLTLGAITPASVNGVASPTGTLSSTTGINAKTIATTNLYTVPAGKTAVIVGVVVRVTTASAITVAPTVGVGVAAGEDDIMIPTSLTGLDAVTKCYTFSIAGTIHLAAAAEVIKVGIDTGATATTMTISVDLIGYLF